jgi:rod shape-determining protein MreB
MRLRAPAGVAVDLGSARAKFCVPDQCPLDVPTTAPYAGPRNGATGRPVSRGRVLDVRAAAALVADLVDGLRTGNLLVVATTPVLCGDRDRENVRAAMIAAGASDVLTIDGVKAAALGAEVDLIEPLLVVDVGAELVEVALLSEGLVVEARCAQVGLDDDVPPATLVGEAADGILELLRGDRGSQVAEALDRGILLTGGGGLHPEIAATLGERLATAVRPAPAPHTVAVRGAATALRAARRHPGFRRH